MERRYPDRPMVGVGAIVFRGEKVLIVRRGREPSYGEWSVPGGLVEAGETLEEAVRREALEEVGLDVKVVDLAAALDRVLLDADGRVEYHYILMDFVCECPDGEPVASSDALDCLFVSFDELANYPMTRGTEEVIRRAYARFSNTPSPIYDPNL